MRLWNRKRRPNEHAAVVTALEDLKREFSHPIDRSYINDMLLYTSVGRDRRALTMDYVEQARQHLTASKAFRQ